MEHSEQHGLVSVGMATRNGSAHIRAAIDSILNQTYTNLELIISDNASDDAIPEICKAYVARDPRVRYIRQAHDVGSFENCNATIRAARGEFFMRADDDDIRPPTAIADAVHALRAHPDAILAFGDMHTIDPHTHIRVDYSAAHYFPAAHGRYARVRQFLQFHLSDGKGLLLFGLWRRRVLGSGISLTRGFYFGWDENYLLEHLIEAPFVYIPKTFFIKGARTTPLDPSSSRRVVRSLIGRVQRFFAPVYSYNIGIIFASPAFTFFEKMGLIGIELLVMLRLFFVRKT